MHYVLGVDNDDTAQTADCGWCRLIYCRDVLSATGFDVGERTPAMTNENCRMPLRPGVLRHRRGAVEDALAGHIRR